VSNALAAFRTTPPWREIACTVSSRAGGTDGVLPPLMILLTIVTGIVDAAGPMPYSPAVG